MTDKEIFYFTGRCLALDANPEFREEIINKSNSGRIDWTQFVGLCSDHLILPAIFLKFQKHSVLKHIPEELSEHLQEIYELNVFRNTQILKQIRELTIVLNMNKIYPLFLKGAGNLLDSIYSDIGERILGDIDFLVPEKDYLRSAELMINEGYSKLQDTPDYTDIEKLKHYPRLIHPDFESVIEVHRIPTDEKYQSWFNPETIDREKRVISSLSGCFVLSDHHKIVLNFIHGQLANEGHLLGRVSLRGIYDLYLISKRFSLMEAIPAIKTKQKAIAYFALSRLVLGLNESFFSQRNLSYRLLFTKHTLNLSSPVFRRTYRSLIFLSQRFFIGYIGQIVMALYSKEKQQYISRRIKNREWYGNHVQLYSRFFKKNK